MGDLLGRLHSLPLDDSVSRQGGASGEDPSREGSPRQDLLASLGFLDVYEANMTVIDLAAIDDLRARLRAADDGDGLPTALIHGNMLHAFDHVVVGDRGPMAIQWKASGRGPRLADFAYLMWGAGRVRLDVDWIDAVVGAYSSHVALDDDELDRLEGVMHVRPLYLACIGYATGQRSIDHPMDDERWLRHISANASATRAAVRRGRS